MQRYEIVKRAGICFNCLGHHKASQCRTKIRCKNCNRKHNTSICKGENEEKEEKIRKKLTPTESILTTSKTVSYNNTQTSLLKIATANVS